MKDNKFETKEEYVKALRALANHYETGVPEAVQKYSDPFQRLVFFFSTKDDLADTMRAFGGRWNKVLAWPNKDFATFNLYSTTLPITLQISRDKVCKKTVRYDCEPMFSPADEKEIEVLANG